MRTFKIKESLSLKADEINLLFAGSISAILTNAIYWFSGNTVSLWFSLVFFLLAYPWKIFGATFSLFGGASDQGNIYSCVSLFQVAEDGSCESIFGLNLFSKAHKDIFCVLGVNAFSRASGNITCLVGINLFSKASDIFCILGVNLFSNSTSKDIGSLFGLNIFSNASGDVFVFAGLNLFSKAVENVYCFAIGANFFSQAGENIICSIGLNLFTKAERSSVLGFGIPFRQKAPVFSGVSFSLINQVLKHKTRQNH